MIYENVKAICEKKKMSLASVEKAAGLGNGTISCWRNSSPTVSKLQAVAKILGVKVSKLLEGV